MSIVFFDQYHPDNIRIIVISTTDRKVDNILSESRPRTHELLRIKIQYHIKGTKDFNSVQTALNLV